MLELTLTDKMPFGKYKSQTVEEIFKTDAGYLVWLRDERKKSNQDVRFFSKEVLALLDMTIRESKPLSKKYQPWDLPIDQSVKTEATPQDRPAEVNYGGAWGGF
jgi:uncharacterized protein (DUF3820 family)